jgi:succinate dehydrogenase / fumarate reductase membrane anchor subunit
MVKSVLGVNHQGLRDWMVQRLSAVLMVFYTVGLFVFFVLHPHVNYAEWHALFSKTGMKISTLLVLLFLLGHTWVGMWTILTDYVKSFVVCLLLETMVLLALIAFFFSGCLILWGV